MNGVTRKFCTKDVQETLAGNDIVIISETHFNIRTRCPDGFFMVARSKASGDKKPRGGVAIYVNTYTEMKIKVLSDEFQDMIAFEIENTDIVIIAAYIPPYKTLYYDDECFEQIKLLWDIYSTNRTLYLVGDLNARVGNMNNTTRNNSYAANPDPLTNQNGRKLNMILPETDMIIINGLHDPCRRFDTNYTFYRGTSRTQIDLALTNCTQHLQSFAIMDKLPQSDHCPCILSFKANFRYPFHFLQNCAAGFLDYDYYDVNKRINNSISVKKCNLTQLSTKLIDLSSTIKRKYQNSPNNIDVINDMNSDITNGIYNACAESKCRKPTPSPYLQHENCESKNFKAIAEANLVRYQDLQSTDTIAADYYWNQWLMYADLAQFKEKEELSLTNTRRWKHLMDKDPKKLWMQIDWKGQPKTRPEELHQEIIYTFFKNIFQSPYLDDKPKLIDISEELSAYDVTSDITDKDIEMPELETAIKKLGTGSSFDGIAPDIIRILPKSMVECILHLYRMIFDGDYPYQWKKQLLIPSPKKGHTEYDPKLRGIAMGPVLSRLYDIVQDNRFITWYHPNPEQAGFRVFQGCLLQIFSLMILLHLAKELGKELYIGLIDYEKAFDFVNRAELAHSFMSNNIGSRYLRNFTNTYRETEYITKISSSRMGKEICTDHGLTQGKNSSANFFSLFVSDMSKAMVPNTCDFMDPMNLFQLADDTTTAADNVPSFASKMKNIFDYSIQKHQKVNKSKTKYLHMSNNPRYDPIRIDEETQIESVKRNDGYNWLGFFLHATSEIEQLLSFNINKKMVNTCKFYSWLQMNLDTPFNLKIKVLYSCMFESILYSCEAWCNFSGIVDKLLVIERKAIRRILGVKQSTTVDLIYQEIGRPDIAAVIKARQYKFMQKINNFTPQDAVVRMLWDLYQQLSKEKTLTTYYNNLEENVVEQNKNKRRERIVRSNESMCQRYRTLLSLEPCQALYSTVCDDQDRIIITRWRLSSHNLHIETGRRKKPKPPRTERRCIVCNTIEDEEHTLFNCTAHTFIRLRFENLLAKYTNVRNILDPTAEDIREVAGYIKEIEKNMEILKMIQ